MREDDIWLVTWPKVGSTWTQETVWQIVNNVDKVGGQMPQLVRVPWVEFGAILPKESLGKLPPPPEGTPKEVRHASQYISEALLLHCLLYTSDAADE